MIGTQRPLWLGVLATAAHLASATPDDRATITIAPRQTPVNNAVIPTTTGQIGVNPVEDELGGENYRGVIQHLTASQSSLLTEQGGSTTWLAKHIDFLTETTVDGTTSTVQLSVATAAAAAGGVAVGDITVVLAEGLADSLAKAADAAVQACGALNAKRDINGLSRRATDDGKISTLQPIPPPCLNKRSSVLTIVFLQFCHACCLKAQTPMLTVEYSLLLIRPSGRPSWSTLLPTPPR